MTHIPDAPTTASAARPAMPLRAALAAAAAEMNREQPPAWIERATLAAAPAGPPARGPVPGGRRWLGGWPGAAALACALLVSVLLLSMPAPRPGADQPSGFMPLVSADMLAAATAMPTAAWLVSTEMPRERLAALGLPFDPARAGDSVHAELLMNASGQVLAVRLMPE